jgi:hypothetical protein
MLLMIQSLFDFECGPEIQVRRGDQSAECLTPSSSQVSIQFLATNTVECFRLHVDCSYAHGTFQTKFKRDPSFIDSTVHALLLKL